MLRILCTLLASVLAVSLSAQGSAEDYRRTNELLSKWRRAGHAFDPDIRWLPNGGLWFSMGRGEEKEFVLVTRDGVVRKGGDASQLGVEDKPTALKPKRRWRSSSRSRRATTVTFENRLKRTIRMFWIDERGATRAYGEIAPGKKVTHSTYVGHAWVGDYEKDDLVGLFVAESGKNLAIFDDESRRLAKASTPKKEERDQPATYVREHDVWLRDPDGGDKRLTTDGTAEDGYRQPRHRSPNGQSTLGFRVAPGEKHPVHIVESSPRDQVQPKLHTRNYRKPGDRIDRSQPVLFDLANGRRVDVAEKPFENAWSINKVRWAADSKEVYCLYNQRGHQLLRLYAIDAKTGEVRTVLEEKSDTFIDYSQKTWLHWLAEGRSLLWASERDGHNHLYHIETKTGAVQQVTHGEWVVRKVEHVDESKQQIWFTAYGIHPDQDPYHAHLARVDFDGKNLTVLTESDGSHVWRFSPDRSMLIARWSRADHPWVTELRRASDGQLVHELGRDDVTELLDTGFLAPERFVAKGRDGKTDIHGILIKPSNFDPKRSYPVVEDIYAGPHNYFVPKRWGIGARQRKIAELGFIVVRIDGMGTNWRSREFHDVCWRNLKDSGFPDRIAWLRAAAATRPYLDLTRVGIFGGSAGGQSALSAMLHHADFYDAAVSDCGCHDNRMDKIWWNEAWMGWPIGPWYADSSNVTHAAKLQGKLLLTVGERDRNVDPASTMQVVDTLIRANKDFDLVVVPGAGHGIGEGSYLVRRRQDFFVRHLLGVEPRHL